MRSIYFQAQLSAIMAQTTRNLVSVTKQIELPIAVPTIEEQQAIANRAAKILKFADDSLTGVKYAQRVV